eukprot:6778654-Prorocentrum_lima.AAC.1
MTSSLVGSEMCIRDRVVVAMEAEADTAPREDDLGTRRARSSPPSPPCHCLLYTSDAADDM